MENSKNLKKFWEKEYVEWGKRKSRRGYGTLVYNLNLKKIIKKNTKSLEVGFGDGRYLDLLSGSGVDVYGIDITPSSTKYGKKNGFNICLADARHLPFKDNSFDLTYSFGVIEHFHETKKALMEHTRVTRSNGRVIITVPYLFSPYTILAFLWHLKKGTWKQRPASFGKRYTKKQIKRVFNDINYKSLEITPFYVGAICEFYLFRFLKEVILKYIEKNRLFKNFGMMLWIECILEKKSGSF